ncbi:hypothetical protein J31TS4_15630 [Paenibacillus sp. J31TS4]|uniref:hypothetical protein n=1 Tax=Paenibacillus sp. J31TS4 TaxID=2807195 RepID=UPI001B0D42FA|nr:hypothetical protein [Paenibacillus sp. J31TS4]GIP38283.1 hypothetical protein J31TS4_15630 [Paenibacillus sp. J31TS4]
MNKLARTLVAPLAISAALFSSTALAADSQDLRIPESITINENMTLFDVSNSTVIGPSGYALAAPQKVTVIGVGSASSSDKYYVVDTWTGPKAINISNRDVTPIFNDFLLNKTVQINGVAALYNGPSYDTYSGASLSPQRVKVVGTNGSNYVQINTWMGPKWIDKRNVSE